MLRRASYHLNIHARNLSSSLTNNASKYTGPRLGRYGRSIAVATVGAVVGGAVVWFYPRNLIHNEAAMQLENGKVPKNKKSPDTVAQEKLDPDALHSLIWGSDKYVISLVRRFRSLNTSFFPFSNNIISPGTSGTDSIRVPTVAVWLEGVALWDLRLHDTHAACVDARGDVYQWGDGFFGQTSSNLDGKPRRTLRGKVCCFF